jgi:hypothetical protein
MENVEIALKSDNGNTVGYINLTNSFTKAVLGKSANNVTFEEVTSINNGDFLSYLHGLTICISTSAKENVPLEEF